MRLLLALILLPWTVLGASYFASPTGGGSGASQASPTTVAGGLALLSAGDTLYLLNGTYTGVSSMLVPTPGLSGTAASRITVAALSDGGATIDGQGARNPCFGRTNDNWTVQGINFANSNNRSVVDWGYSTNCIFSRLCAWNAPININETVYWFGGGGEAGRPTGWHLVVDCAGWGSGRKILSASEGGNNITFRRFFAVWQGCTFNGPTMGVSFWYNNTNNVFENVLSMWDATLQGANPVLQGYGPFAFDNQLGLTDPIPHAGPFVIGCAARTPVNAITNGCAQIIDIGWTAGNQNGWMQDCAAYAPQTGIKPFYVGNCPHTNITAVGATASTWGGVAHLNRFESASAADFYAVFAAATPAQGAHIYYRTEDKVLTSTPLWPWPMNARIKALTGWDVTLLFTGNSGPGPVASVSNVRLGKVVIGQ